MNGYDVVVVGGRVAGASTALLLTRAGVQVVLMTAMSPSARTASARRWHVRLLRR